MSTTIHSNGSKWGGEAPDTIEQLVEALKAHTIEDSFFFKFKYNHTGEKIKFCVSTPITRKDGVYTFFGNFEEVSHVFRIETTDKAVIKKLRKAIMSNAGWKAGVELLKRKAEINWHF